MADARHPTGLLREARALDGARRYPELAKLLEGAADTDVEAEPEIGFLRADVFRRVGRAVEAMETLEAIEPLLARRGNDRLHRRRLNLLGSLQFETGRMDEAGTTWLQQLVDASDSDDREFIARANNNLGVLATIRGALPQALTHYNRALAAYHQLGYARGSGQSHHNLGITYREMEFHRDADAHFRRALHFAREADSEDEIARVEQERAFLVFLAGDAELARAMSERAFERYRRLDDPAGEGEVLRVLGLVDLGEGRLDSSERHFKDALRRAADCGHVLLQAEVREGIAALLGARGEREAARGEEGLADRLFGSAGLEAWGKRTRNRVRAIAARGAQI